MDDGDDDDNEECCLSSKIILSFWVCYVVDSWGVSTVTCYASNNFGENIELYERVSYLFVEQGMWEVMENIDF